MSNYTFSGEGFKKVGELKDENKKKAIMESISFWAERRLTKLYITPDNFLFRKEIGAKSYIECMKKIKKLDSNASLKEIDIKNSKEKDSLKETDKKNTK